MKEVVASVARVTGRAVDHTFAPRRPGDPAILLASSERAREEFGWTPRFEQLDDIVRTAWVWHQAHPDGYQSRP